MDSSDSCPSSFELVPKRMQAKKTATITGKTTKGEEILIGKLPVGRISKLRATAGAGALRVETLVL